MMNVSAGYFNPHSNKEYVVLKDLERTIKNLVSFAKSYKTKEKYVRIVQKPKAKPAAQTTLTYNGITWGQRIEQEDDSLLEYMNNIGKYDETDY